MKTTNTKLWLSLILCLALIAALALMTVGCSDTDTEAPETNAETAAETAAETLGETVAETRASANTTAETSADSPVTVKGEGNTTFYFNVIDKDGNVTKFEIHTDKTTVGDALLEVELIAGEEGAYGLYVKTVNGITADYNKDQTWWEFMVGDQSSMTGVDLTNVEAGATYAFRVSK